MAAPCVIFPLVTRLGYFRNSLAKSSFAASYLIRKYSANQRRKRSRHIKDPRQNTHYTYDPHDGLGREKLLADRIPPLNKQNKGTAQKPAHLKNMEIGKRSTQFGHIYEKLKDGDIRFGRNILSAKSSAESESILLEGKRLIEDAILLGATLKQLYFCEEEILKGLEPSMVGEAEIFRVLYRDMKTWSSTTTPSGIMGVFKKPQQGEVYSWEEPRLPLTLILDGVKDPGNVGTLIRTAAAVGCQRVLALKGCADLWEGKVLRSGMGAHFAVPLYTGVSWSQVHSYMRDNTKVLLAEARTEEILIKKFNPKVTTEQVNEASASLDNSSSDSDSDGTSSESEDDEAVQVNSRQQTLYNSLPFPVIPYTKMTFDPSDSGQEVALVLGSETSGLSASAKKFAYDHYGTFVTIPMNPAIDSLNTAVAGSVILYDIHSKLSSLRSSSQPA